jgi:AcrR family transcriptional regulator
VTSALAEAAGGPERKSDRTRRRILDAAAELLSRKGFDGTRLSEIAALAELRVPAVYYYFDSREATLEEVVTIGGRRVLENVRARLAALPPTVTALDRVIAAFGAHVEMVLEESTYTAAALHTLGRLPPDIRARQLAQQQETAQLWRDLIAAAAEAGEIDPGLDLRAARMLLLGAANWASAWWNPERGPAEDVIATVERLVRNALTHPAAPASPGSSADSADSDDNADNADSDANAERPASLSPVFTPPSH